MQTKEIKDVNLNSKSCESVLIGDDISITVLSVRGNQVKLGVQAPKEVIRSPRGNLPTNSAVKR